MGVNLWPRFANWVRREKSQSSKLRKPINHHLLTVRAQMFVYMEQKTRLKKSEGASARRSKSNHGKSVIAKMDLRNNILPNMATAAVVVAERLVTFRGN